MGLLEASDWAAHWISRDPQVQTQPDPASTTQVRSSFSLRKEFKVPRSVKRARLYASGLGLYELHLNGQRAGSNVLAPEWTDYAKHVQYQVYDVTNLLHTGDNAMGAVLGNGWWAVSLSQASPDPHLPGNLRFILQLDIQYQDGSQDRLVTDKSWKAHPSPITHNSLYDGETYDARLEMPGWDASGFDGRAWSNAVEADEPAGLLVAQMNEPIQTTQELPAVSVTAPAQGVYVFDFGQNLAGRVRLRASGPRGSRVQLRFAELLQPDGQIYRGNLRGAKATDCYILRGNGLETWESSFTYHGFRYCELTGYPGVPSQGALVARVLHSAVPRSGTFECSNNLINAVYRNILWTQRSNTYGIPTDCPQRDERLGWTGDAQLFAQTACWNMHMASLFTKWMRDLRDAQRQDGCVPEVAPVVGDPGPGKAGWGDACVIIPWTVYRFYSDTRIIQENYGTMAAWIEYLKRDSKDDLCTKDTFGDWVAPMPSPKSVLANAYYHYSASLMSEMARAIGKPEDATKYTELAQRIAAAANQAYFNAATNNYNGGTQTANLLPLYFGMVPAHRQDAVFQNIVRDIHARDDHLSTGFLGTAYLLTALAEHGQQELAYRLATQTTYPSWGYMVAQDATTIWERWNSDRLGPRMNSHNQPALGSMGRWFYESLAGIRTDPTGPGFKKIIIRPQPAGGLKWVKAEYLSVYGPIRSEWHRQDNGLSMSVTIPANTSARIFAPTLGKRQPRVAEGNVVTLSEGRAVGEVPGIMFSALTSDSAIFDVGSGDYTFTVTGE